MFGVLLPLLWGEWVQGAKATVPDLTKLLRDEIPSIQREAAEALGKIGPDAKTAVPALLTLLNDKNNRFIRPQSKPWKRSRRTNKIRFART